MCMWPRQLNSRSCALEALAKRVRESSLSNKLILHPTLLKDCLYFSKKISIIDEAYFHIWCIAQMGFLIESLFKKFGNNFYATQFIMCPTTHCTFLSKNTEFQQKKISEFQNNSLRNVKVQPF